MAVAHDGHLWLMLTDEVPARAAGTAGGGKMMRGLPCPGTMPCGKGLKTGGGAGLPTEQSGSVGQGPIVPQIPEKIKAENKAAAAPQDKVTCKRTA
ncbi:hypothetical protein [Candidatus Electronema sp. JM]|uniref:hypothetical protein n=1 Tax=Candidatus Electronema sp. JM TaxID=3401571 RepID=UPI003AA8D375